MADILDLQSSFVSVGGVQVLPWPRVSLALLQSMRRPQSEAVLSCKPVLLTHHNPVTSGACQSGPGGHQLHI